MMVYRVLVILLSGLMIYGCTQSYSGTTFVVTVNGKIDAADMGLTLQHEHVMVDFIGADSVSTERYDVDSVYNKVIPYLMELKKYNVQTFVEATPAYLGRDVQLLQALSNASGINIITNTGYYAANGNIHLPKHFYEESIDQISQRWINEYVNGIDGTLIKPGFIKISINEGDISEIDAKVVRAAAKAHLVTGLTIMAHTGTSVGAFQEMAILEEENVHPSAMIWVHAQEEQDLSKFVEAAKKGVWVSFDGAAWEPAEVYVKLLQNMKTNGVLNKTLISHDAGWYNVGDPNGGEEFQPYTFIFTGLIPALKENGFTDAEIDMLLIENPAKAFSIQVRKLN